MAASPAAGVETMSGSLRDAPPARAHDVHERTYRQIRTERTINGRAEDACWGGRRTGFPQMLYPARMLDGERQWRFALAAAIHFMPQPGENRSRAHVSKRGRSNGTATTRTSRRRPDAPETIEEQLYLRSTKPSPRPAKYAHASTDGKLDKLMPSTNASRLPLEKQRVMSLQQRDDARRRAEALGWPAVTSGDERAPDRGKVIGQAPSDIPDKLLRRGRARH